MLEQSTVKRPQTNYGYGSRTESATAKGDADVGIVMVKEGTQSVLSLFLDRLIMHRNELADLRARTEGFIYRFNGTTLSQSVELDAPIEGTQSGVAHLIESEMAIIVLLTSDIRERLSVINKVA